MTVGVRGMTQALAHLDHFSAPRLRARLRATSLEAAQIAKRAIEAESPVGDPSTDKNSGKLRGEVRVRHARGGGLKIGPYSRGANESVKIESVIHGRRHGVHGTTSPNAYVDRAKDKIEPAIVRMFNITVMKG
jgi:hypothetical protein